MRITKLTLENFRSFKERQTIEFAPVTLLFGPNSVGKSTVLMALFYVQQILGKGQCDPQYIDALGEKFVGGFKNLVNGQDLDKAITLSIEYSKEGVIGSSYYNLIDLEVIDFYLDSPSVQADTVSVTLEIKWSKQENTAYVSSLEIGLDEIPAAILSSDSGLKKPEISWLNYAHPLLNFETDSYQHFTDVTNEPAPCISTFHEYCVGFAPQQSLNYLEEYPGSAYYSAPKLVQDKLGIKASNGCLPELSCLLNVKTNISEETKYLTELLGESGSDVEYHMFNSVINEIFSDLIVSPLDNLFSLLNESICIGPLRHIPDALHHPNPYVEQKDWHNGIGAWDSLSSLDLPTLLKIDGWMTDENKLGLGVGLGLSLDLAQPIDVPLRSEKGSLYNSVHEKLKIEESKLDEIKDKESQWLEYFELAELPQDGVKDISLWDLSSNLKVMSSDVGVGVSQLMPLVIASLTKKKGLVACEQPELHVHPKVQVAIGDLLTQGNDKSSFLIETHSEHLILRLLRRVRETSERNLPEGFNPVKPEDISVVFLERSPQGVKVNRLAVTEDGDFETEWPGGFFDERDEELF